MITLEALPADVLLHILTFCSLTDAVRFTEVCNAFHLLSRNRAFWSSVLHVARATKPIACPFYEDFTLHNVASLKKIAFHTLRLEHNWSKPEPSIIGPIRTIDLRSTSLDVIFQVPGTDLYLMHERKDGTVVAWDMSIGQRVSEPTFVSKKILDVSPGVEKPGSFRMGLLTSESEQPDFAYLHNSLKVVCLEYGPSGVKVRLVLSEALDPLLYHWAVFMTDDYVGTLQCQPSPEPEELPDVDIVAYNLARGTQIAIHTDIERNQFAYDGQSGTSITNGNLHIIVERKTESVVYCCPRSYLPTDDNPSCPANANLKTREHQLKMPWPYSPMHATDPDGVLSADPFYGVPSVSLHTNWQLDPSISAEYSHPYSMEIRFWTSPPPQLRKAQGYKNEFTHLHLSHRVQVDGTLADSADSCWQLMLLPRSGRKVLLVLELEDDDMVLKLISLDWEENKPSEHTLNLPPFIDISMIYGLGLDDHKGVVTLLDKRGYLFALPYA